jgi:PTH1 family peptidyl-tRNA hydrolase
LPKRTTFISNRQTVPLEYKFKGRTFSFKAEYLHELIWESGNTGWTKKIFHLKTSLFTDDLNLSFGTITSSLKEAMELQRIKNINLILNTNQYTRFRLELVTNSKRQNKSIMFLIGMTPEKTALPERLELASKS